MNAKTLLSSTFSIAVAAFACVAAMPATAAMVGDANPGYPMTQQSTLTRAQVQSELALARANGQIQRGERVVEAAPVGMPNTRAQVQAELREAMRLGVLNRGEKNSFLSDGQIDSIRNAGLRAVDAMAASSGTPTLR
jgi:hypothetical protein